jgi:hypothetical protein
MKSDLKCTLICWDLSVMNCLPFLQFGPCIFLWWVKDQQIHHSFNVLVHNILLHVSAFQNAIIRDSDMNMLRWCPMSWKAEQHVQIGLPEDDIWKCRNMQECIEHQYIKWVMYLLVFYSSKYLTLCECTEKCELPWNKIFVRLNSDRGESPGRKHTAFRIRRKFEVKKISVDCWITTERGKWIKVYFKILK